LASTPLFDRTNRDLHPAAVCVKMFSCSPDYRRKIILLDWGWKPCYAPRSSFSYAFGYQLQPWAVSGRRTGSPGLVERDKSRNRGKLCAANDLIDGEGGEDTLSPLFLPNEANFLGRRCAWMWLRGIGLCREARENSIGFVCPDWLRFGPCLARKWAFFGGAQGYSLVAFRVARGKQACG